LIKYLGKLYISDHAVVAAGTRGALRVNLEAAGDGAAAGVALAVGLRPAVAVLPVVHHAVTAEAILPQLAVHPGSMLLTSTH
jgi:hypothetical protein